jgi:hypothetical protein
MIVVRIYGGLGNQMFQYAAARALAAKYEVPLKLDLRWMSGYRHRDFLLDRFPIPIDNPSWTERLKFTWFPFRRRPFFVYTKLIRKVNPLLYMEPAFPYNRGFWNLGPDCFLFGYFQSEKYFAEYEELIRKDFSYGPDLSLYDSAVIRAVRSPGSTAIQFRRGDYVTNVSTNRSIGVCPMEFYERAVAYLESLQKPVRPVVFSDEIDWCRENVKFKDAVFVERRGGIPLDDMFLATQCDNIILANSTFSWWSAWLNPNPSKRVVAPKQWYKSRELADQAYDLIPEGWIRL